MVLAGFDSLFGTAVGLELQVRAHGEAQSG